MHFYGWKSEHTSVERGDQQRHRMSCPSLQGRLRVTKSVLVSNGCVACNMCVTLAGRPYSVPALPILACPIHLGILRRQFLSSLPDDDTHVRLPRHGAKKFCNPHSGVTQPGLKKFCSYPGAGTDNGNKGNWGLFTRQKSYGCDDERKAE